MTIVEFYDNTQIENVVNIIASGPDKVYFVGEWSAMQKQQPRFERFLADCGISVQLIFRGVNKNRLDAIVTALDDIVQAELEAGAEIAFDLTGGADLAMVAMGIIYDRYRGRGLQLHRYNIRSRNVFDCDLDGQVISGQIPEITVQQQIILNGGSVVWEGEGTEPGRGTPQWDLDEDFRADIGRIWAICCRNPGWYNAQCMVLEAAGELFAIPADSLTMSWPVQHLETYMKNKGKYLENLLDDFLQAGLLTELTAADGRITLAFKNLQVKRVLTKAGDILELVTLLACLDARDEDGNYVFGDALMGVYIDWDGVQHAAYESDVDTENEIDVLLMKGLVPVFISCKNGMVGDDELYKLNTVANRFGGLYAKKILVATTLGNKSAGTARQHFLTRAADMGIRVLTDVHKMAPEQFIKKLIAHCNA